MTNVQIFFAVLFGAPFAILSILALVLIIGVVAAGMMLGYFECMKFHANLFNGYGQNNHTCVRHSESYQHAIDPNEKKYGAITTTGNIQMMV